MKTIELHVTTKLSHWRDCEDTIASWSAQQGHKNLKLQKDDEAVWSGVVDAIKDSRMLRVCSEISIINTIFPRRCFKMTTPRGLWSWGMGWGNLGWRCPELTQRWHWQLASSQVEFSLVWLATIITSPHEPDPPHRTFLTQLCFWHGRGDFGALFWDGGALQKMGDSHSGSKHKLYVNALSYTLASGWWKCPGSGWVFTQRGTHQVVASPWQWIQIEIHLIFK